MDVLCLCCAFSAVLDALGHVASCESWRENVSHGVIMTNNPHLTLSPFSPISCYPACQSCPIPPSHPTPSLILLSGGITFSIYLAAETYLYSKHSDCYGLAVLFYRVIQFLKWLLCLLLSHCLIQCTGVIREISFGSHGFPQCEGMFMQAPGFGLCIRRLKGSTVLKRVDRMHVFISPL